MKTFFNKTAKQVLAGLAVLGFALGTSAFTSNENNQEQHYWYQRNPSSEVYTLIGTGMTTRPSGLCPAADGPICAKGFSNLQDASSIDDETVSDDTAFRN